ncbi:MAG: hypothetical protein B5M54_04860 [Candidatus Aminicenantes bacterium 4484_214]|nr:MAG: hypothetical protein B5M54_04860 [Candidatus Aminicenantes bacterium 4484_214]RLE10689.1 MAG: histidine kinase [Candidatus Aminicenantes bacterium]
MFHKKSYRTFMNLPLRVKFLVSFSLVIFLGGILILTIGTRIEHQTIFSLAQAKVRHDLSAARMVYNEKLNDIKDIVLLNSNRESLQNAMKNNNREILLAYLDKMRKQFNLDLLSLTDQQGKVICRPSHPEQWGDLKNEDPYIQQSLQGKIVVGSIVAPREELFQENPALVDQAFIRVVPTPKAAPPTEEAEERGLLLKASAPIIDENGEILGVLYGGILLNKNYEIVDRVKEIVYKGEKYKGTDIGTATIFLYDLRISTNVLNENGKRALGTRVSQEVRQAVLIRGQAWIDRAFVVRDWYITAYEPIKDIEGNIIGMLYVGMLEKPYIDLRNKVMLTFSSMAIASAFILLIILFLITSTIIHPVKSLVEATKKIAAGDLNHQVLIPYHDEIGELAHSFNQMTENLKKANQKLFQWGKTLEKRVAERTRELKEAQDSLIQSAKLASLGKMAAGVAHEINNPLTSILLNTHLLLEKLPPDAPQKETLELIAEETTRCASIVKGLLQFARQSPPQKSETDINSLLLSTLQLLENQAAFQNIEIKKSLSPHLPTLKVDQNKLKQVFWNMLINAAEAMPRGGTLTIETRLSPDQKHLEIIFSDTGVGIPQENLTKLFDPFFTTKSSGTGLGLAVSYGIIKQHQGTIKVSSQVGQGTTFFVILPLDTKEKKPT